MNKSTEKNKAKDKDQKIEEKIVKKPVKKKSLLVDDTRFVPDGILFEAFVPHEF